MAVLVEAISVIIRRNAVEKRFTGGWEAFLCLVPNRTFCSDPDLARVGFMSPADVKAYTSTLEDEGLVFRRDGQAADFAVVDQLRGPTLPAPWLEFGKIETNGMKISACWPAGQSPGEISIPDGWKYEDSLSAESAFVADNAIDDTMKFLRREGTTDVYFDPRTGKETFVGRPNIEGDSEPAIHTRLETICHEVLNIEAKMQPLQALQDEQGLASLVHRLNDQLLPSAQYIAETGGRAMAFAHFTVGLSLRTLHRLDEAELAFRKANKLQPGVINTLPEIVRCLGNRDKQIDTYLAGVMHDERYLVIPKLSLRDLVHLRGEPDNPADANAILVETRDGQQVGHIRRELAAYLAPQINEETQPIQATVTELSSDAEGSAYRVRINFSVPAEWLNQRETVEHTNDQPTEYTYDDNGPNAYVLLNSSEERFKQIREKMTADGISHAQHGLCYRPAHNGRPYQWYIRFNKTSEVNKRLIEDFFRRNFDIAPEFEHIGLLEDAKKRYESEIIELQTRLLKEEKDHENLAEKSELAEQAFQRKIGDLQFEVKAREGELRQIEDEKRRLRYENENLKTFPIYSDTARGADNISDSVADVLKEVISEALTPRKTLLVIKTLFPTRIIVLDSALESAQKSESFRNNKKLFSLLWLLATEYWCALSSGRGDAEARVVFGEHYAAQESDRVQKNQRLRRSRTFLYKGQQLPMMKHLKIGVSSGVSETLRVHFEWVAEDGIIVIGHCGPHL